MSRRFSSPAGNPKDGHFRRSNQQILYLALYLATLRHLLPFLPGVSIDPCADDQPERGVTYSSEGIASKRLATNVSGLSHSPCPKFHQQGLQFCLLTWSATSFNDYPYHLFHLLQCFEVRLGYAIIRRESVVTTEEVTPE